MIDGMKTTRAMSLLVGTLVLTSILIQAAPQTDSLKDKTLVVWVAPANLTQRGGSALTIEKPGGAFDAIVFVELSTGKWMPGSDAFNRTKREQESFPAETANDRTFVQMAIVYQGTQITMYRNGTQIASYTTGGAESFPSESQVLMGLRHTTAAPQNRFSTGAIDDARIYNIALSAEQIAALNPNRPSTPAPVAWWDFEDGSASYRIQTFPATTLIGDAKIRDGKLRLEKKGAYLVAMKAPMDVAGNDINASASLQSSGSQR